MGNITRERGVGRENRRTVFTPDIIKEGMMTMKKLLLSVLMLALALPAFALDIPMPDGMKLNMYGQVRMQAYYNSADTPTVATSEGSYLTYTMLNNSRLGWNFSAGSFKANVELKVEPDQKPSAPIGFRQFWGAYTFENGLTFTAGNKTTLAGSNGYFNDIYNSNSGLSGFGTIGDVRRPLVMLSWYGFDLAIISTEIDDSSNVNAKDKTPVRGELAYNLKAGGLSAKFFASGASIKEQKETITAGHVGAYLNPTFGNMYLKISGYYGINIGMYGSASSTLKIKDAAKMVKPSVKNGDVENSSSFGGALAFGVNILPNLTLEVGGGTAIYGTTDDTVKDDMTTFAAYGQVSYKANKHILLIPQVGYYSITNYNGAANDDRNLLMAGLELRMLF